MGIPRRDGEYRLGENLADLTNASDWGFRGGARVIIKTAAFATGLNQRAPLHQRTSQDGAISESV
jgi:hypothetical protein